METAVASAGTFSAHVRSDFVAAAGILCRPLTLVAHDMGAPPALLWAADHPEEISSLFDLEVPVMLSEVLRKIFDYTPEAMKTGSMWWWLLHSHLRRVVAGTAPAEVGCLAEEVLQIDVENFVHHATSPGPVFFERGVLDAVCALNQITPLNEGELNMWLLNYQYFPKVFVLPPWKAIYENDAERDQTFEHAESVKRMAQAWYRRCGYQIVEVPMVSVDERCTFVLQALATSDARS